MEHLKLSDINHFVITGIVCSNVELREGKIRLSAKCRIKIKTGKNPTYIDVVGFGDVAKTMNLIGTLGSKLYIEGNFANKTYVNKKGITKTQIYFVVRNLNRLFIPKKLDVTEMDEKIEILDEIDPINYLYGDENE